jgi:hypothetical protein
MSESVVTRAYRARKALVIVLLAAIAAGCSGETGTVVATPPTGTGEAASPKGGPRVPRGPEGVKALQDAAAAKKQ